MNIKKFTTKELVEELINRQGIKGITVDPYEEYSISTEKHHIGNTGPAVILEITD